MLLSEKLRSLRTANRLSMSEVARRSARAKDHRGRITQGYLSRLESGRETNPSLMKVLTLCSIYNVDPNTLLMKHRKKRS